MTDLCVKIREEREVQNGLGLGLASCVHVVAHPGNVVRQLGYVRGLRPDPWGTALGHPTDQTAKGPISPHILNSFFAPSWEAC